MNRRPTPDVLQSYRGIVALNVNPLATRRIAAYALDATGYLGIAAATGPVGALAVRTRWGKSPTFIISASAFPVVIATCLAARAETRGATWGKRRLNLRVELSDSRPLTCGRSVTRNVLKIALPWQLGHIVAVGAAFGGFSGPDRRLVAIASLTYGMIGIGLWGLLRQSGITMHDRAVCSRVVLASSAHSHV